MTTLRKLFLALLLVALPALAQSPYMTSSADLFFTNVGPGVQVPNVFDVNGGTSPYNIVQVTVSIANSPYVIFSQTFQADPGGYFGIRVDATRVNPGTLLNIQAQARDPRGMTGPVRVAQVLRI